MNLTTSFTILNKKFNEIDLIRKARAIEPTDVKDSV